MKEASNKLNIAFLNIVSTLFLEIDTKFLNMKIYYTICFMKLLRNQRNSEIIWTSNNAHLCNDNGILF